MKKSNLFFILLVSIFVMQSCEKEPIVPNPNEEVAPSLPPQKSMIMPFTVFEEADTTGIAEADMGGNPNNTYRNWFHAGANLLVWNGVLALNMAIPVASFVEAFNHNPTYAGNGIFEWTYDVEVAGATYIATLTAQYVSVDEVEWIMTTSKVGGFSNFVYYKGIVSDDFSRATWTLYHQPNNPQPYIGIEYKNDVASEELSIRYTNIIPGNPNNGQYIEYRTEPGEQFNRSYDVFGGSTENFLEIEWDEPTFDGRVKHPAHFNDNEWHCWDEEQRDIEC